MFNGASSTTNFEMQKYYQNKLKFNSFLIQEWITKNKKWCMYNNSSWEYL